MWDNHRAVRCPHPGVAMSSIVPPRLVPFLLVALGASATLNIVYLAGAGGTDSEPAQVGMDAAPGAAQNGAIEADEFAWADRVPLAEPAANTAHDPANALALMGAAPAGPVGGEAAVGAAAAGGAHAGAAGAGAGASGVAVPAIAPLPTTADGLPDLSAPGAADRAAAEAEARRAAAAAAAAQAQAQAGGGAVAAPAAAPGQVRVASTTVVGAIPQSLAAAGVVNSDAVSATTTRLLMWDLDLRRDLRAGDPLQVAWTEDGAGAVTIVGAHYTSQRLGQTLTAYRFQASGDQYPSYWTAEGTEVERRLRNSPIRAYEQITSLLRDRPNHHGIDFKAPTGTPVFTPFDGVVTRANWNHAANGNCIEVRFTDGTLAKFLHLSRNDVSEGARVSAGQQIALSGNTGRSSGPHLHYQLNRGDAVLDPIDVHGTERRTLPAGDMAAFRAEVARIDALIANGGALASN